MDRHENGYATAAAKFQQVVSLCAGYGTDYAPSRADITLASLQATSNSMNAELLQLQSLKTNYDHAIDQRKLVFREIRNLTPKIIHAMIGNDCTPEHIERAKSLKRKMSKHAKTRDEDTPESPENPGPVTRSTSQQGFDSVLANFNAILEVLRIDANYQPNEPHLQLAQLEQLYQQAIQWNAGVQSAYSNLVAARILRNDHFKMIGGIVNAVKSYVRSVFGLRSPQVAKLVSVQFRARG